MTRIRSIQGAIDEIKALDPKSAVSVWMLRCLIKDKKIWSFNNGLKLFVDLDNLIAYFNGQADTNKGE